MTSSQADRPVVSSGSDSSAIVLPPSLRPTTTSRVHRAESGPTPWWRSAVIYQIYPRSFMDASGDGIGDLAGVKDKIGHIAKLGVDAIWLSPFYPSPQADAGYDVSDYCEVDPLFGSLSDFAELVKRAHCHSLRVIVDLVPNHTSDEHIWFTEALASEPGSAARDRYIFRDGLGTDGSIPPNNWNSVFGGSAWTRVANPDGTQGQWYLHLFDVKQPDLNWRNSEIAEAFESILRFWLDRGVDGFRVDVASSLIKAEDLPDWNPESVGEGAIPDSGPMWDQDEVHEIYRSWREILESYEGDRVMVAEAWLPDPQRLAKYIRSDEYHQAFNFNHLRTQWSAPKLVDVMTQTLLSHDEVGATATWVLSNHDTVRHASRLGLRTPGALPNGIGATDDQPDEELGLRRARAATALMLALPGSAYLYQGEELGLPEHTELPDELRQDPTWQRSNHCERGRDGCRVPLPWSPHDPAFGFSPTGKSWLPQPESWAQYAAESQYGVSGSTFELYRSALRIRRDCRLGTGSLTWIEPGALAPETPEPACGHNAIAFLNRDVLVVTNFGPNPLEVLINMEVVLSSGLLSVREDGTGVSLPVDTTLWARIS